MDVDFIFAAISVLAALCLAIFLIGLAWRFVVAQEQAAAAQQQMARHFLEIARDVKMLASQTRPDSIK